MTPRRLSMRPYIATFTASFRVRSSSNYTGGWDYGSGETRCAAGDRAYGIIAQSERWRQLRVIRGVARPLPAFACAFSVSASTSSSSPLSLRRIHEHLDVDADGGQSANHSVRGVVFPPSGLLPAWLGALHAPAAVIAARAHALAETAPIGAHRARDVHLRRGRPFMLRTSVWLHIALAAKRCSVSLRACPTGAFLRGLARIYPYVLLAWHTPIPQPHAPRLTLLPSRTPWLAPMRLERTPIPYPLLTAPDRGERPGPGRST
ncbi:hypothetical protein B0H16DRAFT_1738627 [Mycena metata]|uniref:Uncharacterized protein n=1 Tax=Mycena metata TaxID=1033252 RepID=A0AAD7HHC5_9AGAR|nr:hypothetical protein B0H16DRAFT_1738627 [Mycena metata]